MPNPTSTWTQKSDAAVLADLQGLNTAAGISDYSSTAGKVVTWSATPSQDDIETVERYLKVQGDFSLV